MSTLNGNPTTLQSLANNRRTFADYFFNFSLILCLLCLRLHVFVKTIASSMCRGAICKSLVLLSVSLRRIGRLGTTTTEVGLMIGVIKRMMMILTMIQDSAMKMMI